MFAIYTVYLRRLKNRLLVDKGSEEDRSELTLRVILQVEKAKILEKKLLSLSTIVRT